MRVSRDRADAGAQLAGLLLRYPGQRPLVLAIPRGGVPMARVIADALDGDLDVVLVHKIGAPLQPELAIGAVDEHGHVVLDPLAAALGVTAAAARAIADEEVAALRERRASLGSHTAAVAPRGTGLPPTPTTWSACWRQRISRPSRSTSPTSRR